MAKKQSQDANSESNAGTVDQSSQSSKSSKTSEPHSRQEESKAEIDLPSDGSVANDQPPGMLVNLKRLSLGNLTNTINEEIPKLANINESNFDTVLSDFQTTLDETVTATELHTTDYLAKAAAVEKALNALTEYNTKALEQLNGLIRAALAESEQSPFDKCKYTPDT